MSKKYQNKDLFERINYLHQASKLVEDKNPTLSSFYGSLIKQIQKKAVLKIDPSIKRDFCKRCSKAFSEKSKIELVDESMIAVVCDQCNYCKKYPVS